MMDKDTKAWLEYIEQLWQDQCTTLPSVRYEFPRHVDYYRYLGKDALAQEIKTLVEDILSDLREKTLQVAKTIGWCYSMTPARFEDFISAIPWILTAQDNDLSQLDNRHQALEETYMVPFHHAGNKIIKSLQYQRERFNEQIKYLEVSILAIQFATSHGPQPTPFIKMDKDAYSDGEIVVGFFDIGYAPIDFAWASPYLVVVDDSSIDTHHMIVRSLTAEELESCPIALPTPERRDWTCRASYDWVMPLEVYQYYLDHPGLAKEHIKVFIANAFEAKIPLSLEALYYHFKDQ